MFLQWVRMNSADNPRVSAGFGSRCYIILAHMQSMMLLVAYRRLQADWQQLIISTKVMTRHCTDPSQVMILGACVKMKTCFSFVVGILSPARQYKVYSEIFAVFLSERMIPKEI